MRAWAQLLGGGFLSRKDERHWWPALFQKSLLLFRGVDARVRDYHIGSFDVLVKTAVRPNGEVQAV